MIRLPRRLTAHGPLARLGVLVFFVLASSCETMNPPTAPRDRPATRRGSSAPRRSPDRSASIDVGAVRFVKDATFDVGDDRIQLLGGTVWAFDGITLLLPITDVVIVMVSERTGVLCARHGRLTVHLVSGVPLMRSGEIGSVEKATDDGAVVWLNNGTRWEVDGYDRYDTSYWLPPYTVLVEGNEWYMWNLEEGERVGVRRLP